MPYVVGALQDRCHCSYIPIIGVGCLCKAIFAVKANERMRDHGSQHWRTQVCNSRNIILVRK